MKTGDRVLILLPVANYDPKAFPDAESFDLDRENKAHISFNVGPHRCVGSHLARTEMNTFYEEWFRVMPTVRPDPQRRPKIRAGQTFAIDQLWIVWDPNEVDLESSRPRGSRVV